MLLMVENGVRGGLCHFINRYAKVNNKFLKDFDKTREPSYFKYGDVIKLYGWAMPQKLSENGFKWVEDPS